MWIPRLRLC